MPSGIESLVRKLSPVHSERQRQDLKHYFTVYEKNFEQLLPGYFTLLREENLFRPVLDQVGEEHIRANSRKSLELQRVAVHEGLWGPYLHYLIEQGIFYAKLGVGFSDWFKVVHMFRSVITPHLAELYAQDPQRGLQAIGGLNLHLETAVAAIGESYILEKDAIIRNEQHQREILSRELEETAYIISHDLKSPVRAIASLADMMLEDHGDALGANGRAHLQMIQDRAFKMHSLISGVLKFASIDSSVSTIPVPVSDVIQEAIELISPATNVTINVPQYLPKVCIDRTALLQVFMNLMANAVKHNDKDIPVIDIEFSAQGNAPTFFIRDNGPGIDSKHHERIFKIFQTLGNTSQGGSTGLGLAIVKKIVAKVGGKVWLDSQSGQGSTFAFMIPGNLVES